MTDTTTEAVERIIATATGHPWAATACKVLAALAQERDALAESVQRLTAKADDALRRRDEKARGLDDVAAERDAARAEAERLREALRGLVCVLSDDRGEWLGTEWLPGRPIVARFHEARAALAAKGEA